MTDDRYIKISATDVPGYIRWDIPRHNQGQIVEIAYGDHIDKRDLACEGAPYKRILDHSDRAVAYYRNSR